MTGAPAILVGRCNPYGHATDAGPRHLLGGVYGPAYEGPTKWACEQPATGRYRMECQYGHRGQVMPLCLPHRIEIAKRQAGFCPPCGFPPEAQSLHEAIEREQGRLAVLYQMGSLHAVLVVQQRIEAMGYRMTELYQAGVIRKEPLMLTEIS
jgi:hypothetical protein